MPIITVSHKQSAPSEALELLRTGLPDIASKALDCQEEPYDDNLKPGDVNMKFVSVLSKDDSLDYLVEVKTKWTQSREDNLQARSDQIKAELGHLGLDTCGVWIEIPRASWSQ